MATEQRMIYLNDLMKFPIRINHYDKEHGNKHFVLGIETVLEYAETLPTIEARPVVHGRWEECDWVKFDGYSGCIHQPRAAWCCSNCRNAFKKELLWKDNYCPNCGADMRKMEDDKGCK